VAEGEPHVESTFTGSATLFLGCNGCPNQRNINIGEPSIFLEGVSDLPFSVGVDLRNIIDFSGVPELGDLIKGIDDTGEPVIDISVNVNPVISIGSACEDPSACPHAEEIEETADTLAADPAVLESAVNPFGFTQDTIFRKQREQE